MTKTQMVRELDRLEQILRNLIEPADFGTALTGMVEDIRDQAVRNLSELSRNDPRAVPVAQSITVGESPQNNDVHIVSPLDYGGNLEYGTQKIPESPWFRPAVATVLRDTQNRLQRALTVSVRNKVQRTGRPR